MRKKCVFGLSNNLKNGNLQIFLDGKIGNLV